MRSIRDGVYFLLWGLKYTYFKYDNYISNEEAQIGTYLSTIHIFNIFFIPAKKNWDLTTICKSCQYINTWILIMYVLLWFSKMAWNVIKDVFNIIINNFQYY